MKLVSLVKFAKYHYGNVGYIAVDKNMYVHYYEEVPRISTSNECEWVCDCEYKMICDNYTGNIPWKNTLIKLSDCE